MCVFLILMSLSDIIEGILAVLVVNSDMESVSKLMAVSTVFRALFILVSFSSNVLECTLTPSYGVNRFNIGVSLS